MWGWDEEGPTVGGGGCLEGGGDLKSDPSISAECLRGCQLGRSAAQDGNKEGAARGEG